VFGNWLCSVLLVWFFEFLTPSTWGGRSSLNFNSFLMILNVLDVSRGEVEVLFGH
jgi:hypothetical protein